MITLFGATGHTGRLVARILSTTKLPFRIAGRSEEKLRQLSADLPGNPQWIYADVAQPATLANLFKDSQALINCAGPYTDLGERVMAQAAMSGCIYLDVTNELGYIYKARGYHEMARRTGVTILPACGFEVALADCAAAIIASKAKLGEQDQPIDDVNIIYEFGGDKTSSIGTRRSVIRSIATSWIAYRNGEWVGDIPGNQVHRFDLPTGSIYALSIPSGETVTIPTHLNTLRVNVWLAVNRAQHFWGPIIVPLLARASRSILREPILGIAGRRNSIPTDSVGDNMGKESPFSIYISICKGEELHWMNLSGWNPYLLTAKIVAYAAQKIIESPGKRNGLITPAQAIDPHDFLKIASEQWNVNISEGKSNGTTHHRF
jgi:short subunit dehydrogenase-like uncharacterized protein